MERISQALPQIAAQASSGKSSPEVFSPEEFARVNKFFALVRVAWGTAKFNSQFGDAEDVKHTKRFYAKRILQWTEDKLAEAVDTAVERRANGDDEFLFPDVAKILGLIGADWESKRLHRPWNSDEALPDLGDGRYLPPIEDNRTPDEHLSAMKTLLGIQGV